MSKTITEPSEYKKARTLIDKVVEPQIEKIIVQLNDTLKKYGLAAAATINWEFISLEQKKDVSNAKIEDRS